MKTVDRLKTLYSISKYLSVFETVEKSFPKILEHVAESFPLFTAVLIDHWEKYPKTAVWNSSEAKEDQIEYAILHARNSFSYIIGATESETQDFQLQTTSSQTILKSDKSKSFKESKQDNFILLPLAIDGLPPLGALQLEGAAPLKEADLDFVSALASLISVALDRFYKSKWEREIQKIKVDEDLAELNNSREKILVLENERELREEFVSLLTHDLRTPLSASLMAAQFILRKADASPQILALASHIVKNVNRSGQMIINLLDANVIRSGQKIPIRLTSFDIVEFLKNTVIELAIVHGDRFNLKAGIKHLEGTWDQNGIRRIVENLCNNAIKYGSPDKPINIALRKLESEIEITVQNQGNVISPEDQKTLFNQFRRTEAALESKVKGWGIGLTLVRGVTESHGGSVKVKSTEETGTIFTVILPIDQ